ncbi:MAG: hypothetical protein GWO78_06460 [Dehalococcoidales bacterium]|jgi:hypothetical protein|nr:hypothetical protein [Cryomorphaceae bacterium]NCG35612.1 hypothetical protein [Dehalococcoidales bacterium]|tara:strand:+ start:834 stop:1133 length:300 start_codon:yes stop_codon:yes gene_type:complete
MRKSLIIIFFTLLVACSMRLSVSEIEKDLGPSLINDIAEYSNLSNSEIILNSFDLVYDEGNSYSGILNTTYDGMQQTFSVELLYDGETYLYEWELISEK